MCHSVLLLCKNFLIVIVAVVAAIMILLVVAVVVVIITMMITKLTECVEKSNHIMLITVLAITEIFCCINLL